MNDKYSKFLESLFRIQDFIPSRARRKYFERISSLSQQYEAIEARKGNHIRIFQRKAIEKQKETNKMKAVIHLLD